jgi:DNA-binding MarR family transcriptional regulator
MDLNKDKSFGFYIGFINRQAHRYFDQQFKTYDLNRGSIFILKRLYEQDGVRQHDLCDELHLDKANITRAISKLLEMDYVRKEQDVADSRANKIFLTEKAISFKKEFHAIFHSWSNILTGGLSKEQNEEMKQILIIMSENAESYFDIKDEK